MLLPSITQSRIIFSARPLPHSAQRVDDSQLMSSYSIFVFFLLTSVQPISDGLPPQGVTREQLNNSLIECFITEQDHFISA